jgi:hypothetical protein
VAWDGGVNLIAFKGWGLGFPFFFSPFFQGVVFWMERGDFFPCEECLLGEGVQGFLFYF